MKQRLTWCAIASILALAACSPTPSIPGKSVADDAPTDQPGCQLDQDGQYYVVLQELLDVVDAGATVAVCEEVRGPLVVRQDVTLVGPATLTGGPGPAVHVAGGHLVLRDLELVGGTGSPEARLDGDTHGGVVAAWDADALTLDGVVVRDGQADWGGCISGPRSGPLVIEDSVVEDCIARKLAGAVWVRRGVLADSIVRRGQAPYGGGVAVRSLSETDSVGLPGTLIEDCDGEVQGGGLLLTGPGEVWDGTFSGNRSQQGAGVLTSGATGSLRDMVLSDNTAEVGGGGLFVSGGRLTVTDLFIEANRVTGEGLPDGRGVGGGVWMGGAAGDLLVLLDVDIYANMAGWGAGLMAAGPTDGGELPVVSMIGGTLSEGAWGDGAAVVSAELRLDEVVVAANSGAGVSVEGGLLWATGGRWLDNPRGDILTAAGGHDGPGLDWLRCDDEGCVEDPVGPAAIDARR